ncbi:ArsR/SmtB family transcription factor [Pseudopontixanthobacter vadosimaris]|uniref:ArsR/SmtB family transcription factor n=1 Tax=Pseudopontixanthobacter vadosimaris TaxID=2726450 RepID=UPI001473478D|nr:metalloregulator ArsR/SmtB family transcription factor [Pseudopontixanthobacter vadosimaris]
MSDLFSALADPARRRLLDRLCETGGLTLAQLCEGMHMTRQGVAKHLRVLEDANLVASRREGRFRRHYLNPMPLSRIVNRWLHKFEDMRLQELAGYRPDPADKRV